jgi:hypothetical protein
MYTLTFTNSCNVNIDVVLGRGGQPTVLAGQTAKFRCVKPIDGHCPWADWYEPNCGSRTPKAGIGAGSHAVRPQRIDESKKQAAPPQADCNTMEHGCTGTPKRKRWCEGQYNAINAGCGAYPGNIDRGREAAWMACWRPVAEQWKVCVAR